MFSEETLHVFSMSFSCLRLHLSIYTVTIYTVTIYTWWRTTSFSVLPSCTRYKQNRFGGLNSLITFCAYTTRLYNYLISIIHTGTLRFWSVIYINTIQLLLDLSSSSSILTPKYNENMVFLGTTMDCIQLFAYNRILYRFYWNTRLSRQTIKKKNISVYLKESNFARRKLTATRWGELYQKIRNRALQSEGLSYWYKPRTHIPCQLNAPDFVVCGS